MTTNNANKNNLGYAIIRQIQGAQIGQFVQIFDFSDAIVVQKQRRELDHVRKIIDLFNRVALEPQRMDAQLVCIKE